MFIYLLLDLFIDRGNNWDIEIVFVKRENLKRIGKIVFLEQKNGNYVYLY